MKSSSQTPCARGKRWLCSNMRRTPGTRNRIRTQNRTPKRTFFGRNPKTKQAPCYGVRRVPNNVKPDLNTRVEHNVFWSNSCWHSECSASEHLSNTRFLKHHSNTKTKHFHTGSAGPLSISNSPAWSNIRPVCSTSARNLIRTHPNTQVKYSFLAEHCEVRSTVKSLTHTHTLPISHMHTHKHAHTHTHTYLSSSN